MKQISQSLVDFFLQNLQKFIKLNFRDMVVPTNTFQFEVKHHICTQWGNPLSKRGRNFRNNPGQFLIFLNEEVYQALSIKFVFIQGQNNRLAHPLGKIHDPPLF